MKNCGETVCLRAILNAEQLMLTSGAAEFSIKLWMCLPGFLDPVALITGDQKNLRKLGHFGMRPRFVMSDGRAACTGWQMDNSASIQLLYNPDNHYYYSVYLCPEAIKQLHGKET